MTWADAHPNGDPIEGLSHRITDLEQTINTQLSELRTEVGWAANAMSSAGTQVGSPAPLGDLETQLARAVTVSLSAALEAIRESLTEAVADAVADLSKRLESSPPQTSGVRAQFDAVGLDEVAASLQHAVLLALTSFEQSALAQPMPESGDALATARDVARVNQRIDELRSLLLG